MTAALHEVTALERLRSELLGEWLDCYEGPTSRRTMASRLRAVQRACLECDPRAPVNLEAFAWEALDSREFFAAVRGAILERYGRERATPYMMAMRALLRFLVSRGFCSRDLATAALEEARLTRTARDVAPLAFTSGDLSRLLSVCRFDPARVTGYRDMALIALTASTGARRREVVGLDLADLDLADRSVTLRVKGGGTRRAYLHPETVRYLEAWLEVRGDAAGPPFPALRKGGHLTDRPLSDHQFWKLLGRRCEQAGVTPVIAPHDLRRWFVTSLLTSGVDVFQVSRAVGHANVQTTLRYDRRSAELLREVVESLSVPLFVNLEEPAHLEAAPPTLPSSGDNAVGLGA